MRSYKRRNYFIDKQFQAKYILLVMFMLIMYTITFVAILFIPQLLPLIFNSPMDEQVKAAEILLLYHKHVWPAVFIVIPLFGFFSIFITHKIAGPVYRVKKKLNEMTSWNLEGRLSLRTGDDLQDLADSVNLLSEELKVFIAALKSNYATISEHIEAIKTQVENNELNDITGRDLIVRLEASRQSIADTLERFKLAEPPGSPG